MPTPSDMRVDFENVMIENGTSCQFTKHTIAYSGLYGEALYSGTNTTTNGLAMFDPIGPQDLQFLPQGQTVLYPKRMFVHGSIDIDATAIITDLTGSTDGIFNDSFMPTTGSALNTSTGGSGFLAQEFIPVMTGSMNFIQLNCSDGSVYTDPGSMFIIGLSQTSVSGALIASGVFNHTILNNYASGTTLTTFAMNAAIVLSSGIHYFVQWRQLVYGQNSTSINNGLAWACVIGNSVNPVYLRGSAYSNVGSAGWSIYNGSSGTNSFYFNIGSTGGTNYGVIPSMGIKDWVESGTIIYREAMVQRLIGSEFEYVGE